MPNALPNLRGTSFQCLYPITRIVCCYTGVQTFMAGNEQRFVEQPPMTKFVLPMSSLNVTDKNAYLTLFNSLKGRLTQDITLTLGSTTWSNLTLMSDDMVFTAARPLQVDQTIQLRQVVSPASSYTPPSVGSTFPTFSWGGVAQAPLEQTTSFLTAVNEMPAGMRFAWGFYGTGLANFPTGPLKSWTITYSVLTDADLSTLETFFLGTQGRYGSFTFVDPIDGSSHPHTRFDLDELAVKYISPNLNSATIRLLQTNGS